MIYISGPRGCLALGSGWDSLINLKMGIKIQKFNELHNFFFEEQIKDKCLKKTYITATLLDLSLEKVISYDTLKQKF